MTEFAQSPATGAQTGPGAPAYSELLLRLLFQAPLGIPVGPPKPVTPA